MISRLGMAEKVASLTTLCTPHKGSPVASKIWALPRWIKKCLAFFINTFYKLIGDKNPDSLKVCEQLKSSDEIADAECLEYVFCQSYSTTLKKGKDCLLMAVPMKMCANAGEEENDGVVSTESSKFGLYKGDCTDESISHIQIIDFLARRKNRHKIYQFYLDLCSELQGAGY
jgi:triacylglycerol lipase